MKKLIVLLVLSGAVSACSSSGSGARQVGAITCETLGGHYTWDSDPSETLDIADNCTFTDSLCGYDASYTAPQDDGSTVITVNNTNGTPGCLSSTSHMCSIGYNGSKLAVECDGGALLEVYSKQ